MAKLQETKVKEKIQKKHMHKELEEQIFKSWLTNQKQEAWRQLQDIFKMLKEKKKVVY